ncbi:MAG: phage tail protein [Halodesulfovibrio sp.]|uniref:phage tail protein n=1 Tax=Halodesulfovibrio sp. TaxID=1912772 RepID=UPI00359CD88C
MSTVITAAGETLIAQKHISGEALVIDHIILANIPGLDVSLPVDPEQGKPSANKIVYDYVIPQDYKGFVNPNQVVYSMLLGSEVGNFQFNWLGLFSSAENALVAVTHLPVTEKWQTDKGSNTLGNNLTRNFLLQFSGAKAVTNITVEAKTWQVDFTARLRSIDDRERLSNRDIYGRSCFFNDGFKLVKESGKYKLKAGVGYAEGLHCILISDLQIAVSALPKNVFIDVSLQQQGSNVVPVITPKIGSNWEDYTDGNNIRHYCIKIAEISAAGVIKDVRRAEGVTSDLVEYLKRRTDTHANRKDDPHNTLAKVRALFSSSTTNASSSSIATPLAIKTVNDNLSAHKSANDPHGVVAKVKALLTSSITSSSTTTFATPRAVKTVNDSLNAHKSSNDPHGVVAKVKAMLSNSTTSSSTTTFATPKAVKTVNDSLSAHKAGNDPHGVVAKVKALLTSSVTSTSTTMFATPRAVKTVRDLIVGHVGDNSRHSSILPGHIYPVPFPPNELPAHHYVPNGEGLLKTSEAGRALLGMSTAYKTAHRVTTNSTHVFLPNVFDSNGDGYFPRFADGVGRKVGSKQGDAIRNIKGQMLMQHGESKNNYQNGAIFAAGESLSGATGSSTILRSGFGFDASRVVPTSHENRPKNYGFTPAIYLPPLES